MATQGASSFFVTRFQLKFSNNSIEWLDYTENGIVKVKLKISRRSDSFSQRRYRKIKRPFEFKREPNYRIHFQDSNPHDIANQLTKKSHAGEGGLPPSYRLMGMCCWMGSHFHDWIDHNRVTF